MMRSFGSYDPYGYSEEEEEENESQVEENESLQSLKTVNENGKELPKNHNLTKKYGVGAKLLSKMGFVEGKGLGKTGEGIAVPIEPEQRQQGHVGLGNLLDNKFGREREHYSDDSDIQTQIRFDISNQLKFSENKKLSANKEAFLSGYKKYQNILPDNIKNLVKSGDIYLDKNAVVIDLVQKFSTQNDKKSIITSKVDLLDMKVSSIDNSESLLSSFIENSPSDMLLTVELLNDEHGYNLNKDNFQNYINLVLETDDRTDLSDGIVSRCIIERFGTILNNECSIMQFDLSGNKALDELQELTMKLAPSLSRSGSTLNFSQTSIYELIVPQTKHLWEELKTASLEEVQRLNLLLNKYAFLFEFVKMKVFIEQTYIYPYLYDTIVEWKLSDSYMTNPILEITDNYWNEDLEQLLKNKYQKCCEEFSSGKDICISEDNFPIISKLISKDIIYPITNEFLISRLKQLWETDFDLLDEFELWTTSNFDKSHGTFYFITLLKTFKDIMEYKYLTLFLKIMLNELDKLLFELCNYSKPEDRGNVKEFSIWFLNELNSYYFNLEEYVPDKFDKTLTFVEQLSDSELSSIHDENMNLQTELDLLQ